MVKHHTESPLELSIRADSSSDMEWQYCHRHCELEGAMERPRSARDSCGVHSQLLSESKHHELFVARSSLFSGGAYEPRNNL